MSLITISNGSITLTADSHGAVLSSVQKDGLEYLWQGDPAYWGFKDKNLFPYIGRLTDGKYTLSGKEYSLPLHGFATGAVFEVSYVDDTSVVFTLCEDEETLKMYPFPFVYVVKYEVADSGFIKSCRVYNAGESEMYFALGSHPGFNVPLGNDGAFTDWYFSFDEPSSPVRIGFDDATCRLNDADTPYPLEGGTKLALRHDLFDRDAIVLKDMPRAVTLKSDSSTHSVRAAYPDMPFLGLWHMPKKDAPYVCIEPWVALPSHYNYVEDLATQAHLIHLGAGEEYNNVITFTLT